MIYFDAIGSIYFRKKVDSLTYFFLMNSRVAMYSHNLDLNKEDNIFLSLVLEKVVLVKIISMVKTAYDPLSTSQTSRLKELIIKLRNTYPTLTGSSKQVKELLTSVIDKFKASIGKLLLKSSLYSVKAVIFF